MLREIFRGGDHVHACRRIVQGLPKEVLELHSGTQAKAAAVAVGGNRIARHRFAAHAQGQLDTAGQLLARLAQYFQTRAADTLHRQGRHRLWHPAVQADVARQHIGIKTGLRHAPGQYTVNRLRIDTRPRHHLTGNLDAQVDGRDSGQCSPQVGPGRAHHFHDGGIVKDATQPGATHAARPARSMFDASPRYRASTVCARRCRTAR
ncbi:hypothetical protein D3C79_844360 [compost metagenome]